LSKKTGSNPRTSCQQIRLALFDIVMTAGTQESLIQQKLLAANQELKKAPNQLGPFLVYVFKRFGTNLGRFLTEFSTFLEEQGDTRPKIRCNFDAYTKAAPLARPEKPKTWHRVGKSSLKPCLAMKPTWMGKLYLHRVWISGSISGLARLLLHCSRSSSRNNRS